MASKTTNLQLNYNYNKNTETTYSFIKGNDENWEIVDDKIGATLNDMEEAVEILEELITLESSSGTYSDYYKYVEKTVDLKTRLYQILYSKGLSVLSSDKLNELIAKTGSLTTHEEYNKIIAGTATRFTSPEGLTKISQYMFYNHVLEYLVLTNTITIGQYAFYGNSKLQYIDFSKANITSVGDYAFQSCGSSRADLTETLIFDFGNSSLTTVGNYSLANLKSSKIIFPATFTGASGNSYAFNNTINSFIFLNSIPSYLPTITNTNKIFGSYKNGIVDEIKTKFSSYSAYTYTYISGKDVINDFFGIFPTISLEEKYSIVWYEDMAFTVLATTPEANKEYYGVLTAAYFVKYSPINSSINITDGIRTYSSGDQIELGTTLEITFTGDNGTTPYLVQINDTIIADTTSSQTSITYTVQSVSETLNLYCIFWDGVNIPINPDMGQNSWAIIKTAIDGGYHRAFNWVGQYFNITLSNNSSYIIRMIDDLSGRYIATNGKKTNAVFEFVNCYDTAIQFNNADLTGSFVNTTLYEWLNTTFLEMLPSDFRNVLSTPKIYVNNTEGKLDNEAATVFIADFKELTTTGPYNEAKFKICINWSSYINPNTGSAYTYDWQVVSKGKNSTPTTYVKYWCRNLWPSNPKSYTTIVDSNYAYAQSSGNTALLYVAPCFAI